MGVAVLGSLLSTTYRNGIGTHLGAVPASDRSAAGESVEATLAVAQKLGPAGRSLVQPAHDAFIHAMHITAMGSAAVALLGAVVVLISLPRKNATVPAGDGEPQRKTVGAQR
jgi:DHA2 family integral membrane protein (MFS transporter)